MMFSKTLETIQRIYINSDKWTQSHKLRVLLTSHVQLVDFEQFIFDLCELIPDKRELFLRTLAEQEQAELALLMECFSEEEEI